MLSAPTAWDELVNQSVFALHHPAGVPYLLIRPRDVLEVEAWLEEVEEIVERYGQIVRVLQEGGSEE